MEIEQKSIVQKKEDVEVSPVPVTHCLVLLESLTLPALRGTPPLQAIRDTSRMRHGRKGTYVAPRTT
jgi:hypothetical protein